MIGMRIFVSGAMVSHELDTDRESARHAIDALSPEFTAFAYPPFPEGNRPPLETEAKEHGRSEIGQSDALILLVGRTVSSFCIWELMYAHRLGMPCRVFTRSGVEQKAKLRRFLATCPCPIVAYSDPLAELTALVQEFCRSLSLANDEKHDVIVHTVDVWRAIVQELAASPERVFALPARKFEELVAEIIASFGYTTILTPCTRDGGFDILAQREDPLFPSLYLVEAKLWTPSRSVGQPVIQGIYGTGMAENCNGVMVVTPSRFNKDALRYVDTRRLKEYIRLVDGNELPGLYNRYLHGADGEYGGGHTL